MMQQDENSVFNYSELIRELTVLVAGFAAESLVLDGVDFNKSNYSSTGKLYNSKIFFITGVNTHWLNS